MKFNSCIPIIVAIGVLALLPLYPAYALAFSPEPVLRPVNEVGDSQSKMTLKLKNGDTPLELLESHGVPVSEGFVALKALGEHVNLGGLRAGQKFGIVLDVWKDDAKPASLKSLSIRSGATEKLQVQRVPGGGYRVDAVDLPKRYRYGKASMKIDLSLFDAAQKAGVPVNMIVQLIKLYSYDVDFQRDIHQNDTLDLMYAELVDEDGESLGEGEIHYASLNLRGVPHNLYHFTTSDGVADYYNADGDTVRKSLLMTPIDGARLSSGYGMRKHPVLGYNKMHKGMDFAAPRGTPIYASGNGVVTYAGRKGSYGNYVKIRHRNGYSTAYAHMKAVKKGIRKGRKVNQGQVIGYVGTTGRSTGPHLHYEVLQGNRQINPRAVKTVPQRKLAGLPKAIFKQYRRHVVATMQGSPITKPTYQVVLRED